MPNCENRLNRIDILCQISGHHSFTPKRLMRLEHVAIQVENPEEVAQWYKANLGFTSRVSLQKPPHTQFITDSSGSVMLEIYHVPGVAVPDHRAVHRSQLHFAFVTDDVEKDQERLMAAGATPDCPIVNVDDGTRLSFLRDPWGITVQLVQRPEPLL